MYCRFTENNIVHEACKRTLIFISSFAYYSVEFYIQFAHNIQRENHYGEYIILIPKKENNYANFDTFRH